MSQLFELKALISCTYFTGKFFIIRPNYQKDWCCGIKVNLLLRWDPVWVCEFTSPAPLLIPTNPPRNAPGSVLKFQAPPGEIQKEFQSPGPSLHVADIWVVYQHMGDLSSSFVFSSCLSLVVTLCFK